jgi:hypothetical protein
MSTQMSNGAFPTGASRSKRILLAGLSIVIGMAVPLIVAETALRFMPVATGLRAQAVNEASPIFRFMPDRTYVHSRGSDFNGVNRGYINNEGWVDDRDYARGPDPALPTLAVIGDSYVEAQMVPFARTLQGRLATEIAGRGRIYAFAASGAPLSQYLIWARHAVDRHGASALAIVVISNDFDESLAEYKQGPGFWYYAPGPSGALELRRVDYAPSLLRTIIRESAVARHLILNLGLPAAPERLRASIARWSARSEDFAGNVPAQVDSRRRERSLVAIDAFLRDLPAMTGIPVERVVFVVDGFRYPTNAVEGTGSYFQAMRETFIVRARAAGFAAIDMDGAFFARNARDASRFEFPDDGHWNGLAHGLAAEQVLAWSGLAAWLGAAR